MIVDVERLLASEVVDRRESLPLPDRRHHRAGNLVRPLVCGQVILEIHAGLVGAVRALRSSLIVDRAIAALPEPFQGRHRHARKDGSLGRRQRDGGIEPRQDVGHVERGHDLAVVFDLREQRFTWRCHIHLRCVELSKNNGF